MNSQHVNVKLPRTTPTSMIVYPHVQGETRFHLQSERRFVRVDTETGLMTYSKSGSQFSNQYSLMNIRGAKTIKACPELINTLINLNNNHATGKEVPLMG